MKTIKIKLSFAPETNTDERKNKLFNWAMAMIRSKNIRVIEEQHFRDMSYIVIENTGTSSK